MNKIGWTILGMAVLGALPALAQAPAPEGGQYWHRPAQVVQGTVQNVNGPVVVLALPGAPSPTGQTPYAYPTGQLLQIDTTEAIFAAPDGTPTQQQALFPGERVIISVRPAAATGSGYSPADGGASYGGTVNTPYGSASYGNAQYQQPVQYNQQYVAPLRATLVEPLMF